MVELEAESRFEGESRGRLLSLLSQGQTVWTVLKHVSPSGMTRDISCYAVKEGEIVWLDWDVALVCGFTFNRSRETVRVRGCGMDMGFHIVHRLSYKLFEDGYALKHRWI